MKLKDILIIENDVMVLETLKDALEMEGYSVNTAKNIAEAINANLPAMILIGTVFLKEALAKNPRFHNIPIIRTEPWNLVELFAEIEKYFNSDSLAS